MSLSFLCAQRQQLIEWQEVADFQSNDGAWQESHCPARIDRLGGYRCPLQML